MIKFLFKLFLVLIFILYPPHLLSNASATPVFPRLLDYQITLTFDFRNYSGTVNVNGQPFNAGSEFSVTSTLPIDITGGGCPTEGCKAVITESGVRPGDGVFIQVQHDNCNIGQPNLCNPSQMASIGSAFPWRIIGIAGSPGATPAQLCDLNIIFRNILAVISALFGFGFLFMIIIGGIRYLTSGGDPKGTESARRILTYAVIGIILMFVAWLILLAIEAIFMPSPSILNFSICI